MVMEQLTRSALTTLFQPRSVAVVGASSDPTKLGGRILQHLIYNGFVGKIYPINPKAPEIFGIPCLKSTTDLPDGVDVAILALPSDISVEAARQCAERGVKVAINVAAGFAEEASEASLLRHETMKQITREFGMRVVGPNTNGVYNATDHISLGFNTAHGNHIQPGGLALVSHSGALFSTMVKRMQEIGIGLSKFVAAGAETDLTMLDYIEFLLDDEATQVIGLLIDSIDDIARFRTLAQKAQSLGKPLIALKLGRTQGGAAAATAHSSRLAGSGRSYAAIFEKTGVYTVKSIEGLINAAAFFLAASPPAPGTGVGAITFSGGAGAVLADVAFEHGVPLARFSDATNSRLNELRRFGPFVNPVDMGFAGGNDAGPIVIKTLAADPAVSVLVYYAHVMTWGKAHETFINELCQARKTSGKLVIVLSSAGKILPQEENMLREAGIYLVYDSNSCFEGLAALYQAAKRKTLKAEFSSAIGAGPATFPAGTNFKEFLNFRRPLTEPESMAFLAAFGIPVVPGVLAKNLEEATAAAEKIGWPVVLKGVVQGVSHKSDQGLVALNIRNSQELEQAYTDMQKKLSHQSVDFLVQAMISGGLEALVGLTTEPGLGQFLIVGLGGVFAEAMDDVVLVPIPTTPEAIVSRLGETKLGRILTSPRWKTPGSRDQLVDVLLRLQNVSIWSKGRIQAIDINPVLFRPEGIMAVDALVVPGTTGRQD